MYCIFYYLNWHFSKIVYKYFLYFNELCAIPVFEDNVFFIISFQSLSLYLVSLINDKTYSETFLHLHYCSSFLDRFLRKNILTNSEISG